MALEDIQNEAPSQVAMVASWLLVIFIGILVGGVLAMIYSSLDIFSVAVLDPNSPIGFLIWSVVGIIISISMIVPLLIQFRDYLMDMY